MLIQVANGEVINAHISPYFSIVLFEDSLDGR